MKIFDILTVFNLFQITEISRTRPHNKEQVQLGVVGQAAEEGLFVSRVAIVCDDMTAQISPLIVTPVTVTL